MKDAARYIAAGAVATILIVAAFAVGRITAPPPVIESSADTVTKIVTRYKDFPDPVKTAAAGFVKIPDYRFITDTVTNEVLKIVHDETDIYLPREQKYYEEADGALRVWVSGVDPRLDRWEWDQSTTTITEKIQLKPKSWSISAYAGAGSIFIQNRTIFESKAGLSLNYNTSPHCKISISAGGNCTVEGGKILFGPQVEGAIAYDIFQW